jgi:protein-S-isoprenylcysteine O-methyltransferase Ste14
VLFTNLVLVLMFWQWRPIGMVLWDVQHPMGRIALLALCAAGWTTVLVTTFLINHFDLFGLRQVWLFFRARPYVPLSFATPGPYRWVRHPLYVGWLTAFWATPTMTAGHLVFALGTTAYILVAIGFEERDLLHFHGHRYARYRLETPMLIPRMNRSRQLVPEAAAERRRTWRQAIGRLFALVLASLLLTPGCTESETVIWPAAGASVSNAPSAQDRADGNTAPAGSESAGPTPRYEQTRDGVTVRLEKVSVERIYNVRGFLDRHYPPQRADKAAVRPMVNDMASCGSLRLIRFLVTYEGTVKSLGVSIEHPDFEQRLGGEVFTSHDFQQRLPHIALQPDVSGAEIYSLVPEGVVPNQLFPCAVRVMITTRSGSETPFEFATCWRHEPW